MLGLDEKDVFAYYLKLDELPRCYYSTRGVPLSSLLPHVALALSNAAKFLIVLSSKIDEHILIKDSYIIVFDLEV